MKSELIIGTRGSKLALRQSEIIKNQLEQYWPDIKISLRIIKTTGDKITDVPLAKIGGKGLFVKEIEDALLKEEVDIAVHSMKDVPSELPGGLIIGAVPEREDPRDVVVSPSGVPLEKLPKFSSIGTSSLRRAAQLKRMRPDFIIENLRGNLDTRLRKVRDGLFDAIILAAAGIRRMGWSDVITQYLNPDTFLPAVAQGALGIELRSDDAETRKIVQPLHHLPTSYAVEAERSFLKELEGGCQVPIGGHCFVYDNKLRLVGMIASIDGTVFFRDEMVGSFDDASDIGKRLADKLLKSGGKKILDEVYAK